jgi:hypothetical protein
MRGQSSRPRRPRATQQPMRTSPKVRHDRVICVFFIISYYYVICGVEDLWLYLWRSLRHHDVIYGVWNLCWLLMRSLRHHDVLYGVWNLCWFLMRSLRHHDVIYGVWNLCWFLMRSLRHHDVIYGVWNLCWFLMRSLRHHDVIYGVWNLCWFLMRSLRHHDVIYGVVNLCWFLMRSLRHHDVIYGVVNLCWFLMRSLRHHDVIYGVWNLCWFLMRSLRHFSPYQSRRHCCSPVTEWRIVFGALSFAEKQLSWREKALARLGKPHGQARPAAEVCKARDHADMMHLDDICFIIVFPCPSPRPAPWCGPGICSHPFHHKEIRQFANGCVVNVLAQAPAGESAVWLCCECFGPGAGGGECSLPMVVL